MICGKTCSPCSCYKLWTVSDRQRDLISGGYRAREIGVGVVVYRFMPIYVDLAVYTSYGQYLAGGGTWSQVSIGQVDVGRGLWSVDLRQDMLTLQLLQVMDSI